jgi:hypothetical protein
VKQVKNPIDPNRLPDSRIGQEPEAEFCPAVPSLDKARLRYISVNAAAEASPSVVNFRHTYWIFWKWAISSCEKCQIRQPTNVSNIRRCPPPYVEANRFLISCNPAGTHHWVLWLYFKTGAIHRPVPVRLVQNRVTAFGTAIVSAVGEFAIFNRFVLPLAVSQRGVYRQD